jgi:hypothetical protein
MKTFYLIVERLVDFFAEAGPLDGRGWGLVKLRRRDEYGEIS